MGTTPHTIRKSQKLRGLLGRVMSLRYEGLRLYHELPHATPFHESRTKWRVVEGANRSGKTMVAAAEACRAWLGCDPYDKHRPTGGRALVVGLDHDHLASLWAKCAHPGAFRVIRDEHTKALRAVRPDPANPRVLDPYDLAYQEKWKDAPPLIPPRMLNKRSISWDSSGGIPCPRMVRFENGWSVLWRPSGGPAPRGEAWDFGWIDEHIENRQFYYEMVRGLVGIGSGYQSSAIWSATPQRQNFLLWELCRAAENGSQAVSRYFFSIEDNPYIDDGERQILYDTLGDDEERRVRVEGQHALAGWRIYPRFEPMGVHGCEPFPIPDTWTRYLVLDPGTTCCATLFAAVDPDQRHLWVYDQLLLRNADAGQWASRLTERSDAKKFYAWIIDQRAGRQKGMGGYQTVAAQYAQAAKARGVTPFSTGTLSGFIPGCDEPDVRREALAAKLWVRDTGPTAGTAELKVFQGYCQNLVTQVQRAQFDSKNPTKRLRGEFDLLDCLEYLAAYNPSYTAASFRPTIDPVYQAFQRLRSQDVLTGTATLCPGMEIN